MAERLHFHFSLSCIGEGNGNPLQCSCLENTRDGGAWWTAVSGVAQSRIQLKRLSSSCSRHPLASGHRRALGENLLDATWEEKRCILISVSQTTNRMWKENPSRIPQIDHDKCLVVQLLSHVQLFATAWTVARQAPPSMRFSRQECWSELPFCSLGIFPIQGLNPHLLH